jgi:predicted ATP-grasp superfamily ATP-dependent carboligase
LEDFVRSLPLPVVVKPVCGEKLGLAAAGRYVIARTYQDLEDAYRRFLALSGASPVVQSFLTGAGLGCSALCQEGEVVGALCHRRVREYPVTGGPSSCCVSVERPELLDHVQRLAAQTGYTGLAMFEFKEDGEGLPRLLEVNPRIWGTFPLTRVTRSNLSLAWCTLAWNIGNPGSPAALPDCRPQVGKKMIFAASDALAALGYARRGQLKAPIRALGDLLSPAVKDGVFEWGDPRPALVPQKSS